MESGKHELGKHGYSGQCAPGGYGTCPYHTFSVGIFEWILKSDGKGLKKTSAKVRVKGPVSREVEVYIKAKQICTELDAGIYSGPKNVKC